MSCGRFWVGLVAAAMTAGCASIGKSIQDRVTVSEECRDTLASVPAGFGEHTNIASIFIGNVGRCDVTHDESLLAMCSLAQIRTKLGIAPPLDANTVAAGSAGVLREANALLRNLDTRQRPAPHAQLDQATAALREAVAALSAAEAHPDRPSLRARIDAFNGAIRNVDAALPATPDELDTRSLLGSLGTSLAALEVALIPVIGAADVQASADAFDAAVSDLRKAMERLVGQVRALDDRYRDVLAALERDTQALRTRSNAVPRTEALQRIGATDADLRAALSDVRREHEALRRAAERLSASLPQQAGIELAAWDANLRIQLGQLEQILSGDINLVFNAGVKDEVLTHVARRSLELLHGALKPADAVINRLDDKAHGAVSVGYLALWPNLQSGVNTAFENVKAVYQKRQGADGTSAGRSAATDAFLWELKRAACDNLTQGTRFSMLSELVDTMLIMRVGPTPPPAAPPRREETPVDASWPPLRKTRFLLPDAAARSVALRVQPTAQADAAAGAPANSPAAAITPLSVYAVNEWMARQQLLTQKIAETMASPATARDGKPNPFQNIESVDEGLVKQIADAATAQAIDDAARIDPSMLRAAPGAVGSRIANSVNVVTAATAVSQASAVLKVNLSVSNVNTFSPNNYNYNAPTIIVPPAPANGAAASPCAAIDFGAVGATCIDSGGSAVLEFSTRHFDSDSCIPENLEPTLSAIGALLKGYRTRAGASYWATVQGYASLPAARMARCERKAAERANDCKYVNALRTPLGIDDCEGRPSDRNVALSAARARLAAATLERTAEGAVVVERVQARGTATAGSRGAGAPAALDQTVVIRLTPRAGP